MTRKKVVESSSIMYWAMLSYQKKNGFSMTFRELKKEMGLSSLCLVKIRMDYLIKYGLVKQKEHQFRAVDIE